MPSSSALASIPSLSTPSITIGASGRYAVSIPGLQFGAPHTTRLVPKRAVSTMAIWLWLPAIDSTSFTRATEASASAPPTCSSPSHSAVFIVIRRISSSGSVSKPGTSSRIQLIRKFHVRAQNWRKNLKSPLANRRMSSIP